MTALYVDCVTGLAGDMLLAAFLDLGVPQEVIESPLHSIGLANAYALRVEEKRSFGLRGKKVSIELKDYSPSNRTWLEIKRLIVDSSWKDSLKKKVYLVFNSLAEAESLVHGIDINDVHFHEVGAIDSLVDIIGVCAALEHVKPTYLFCSTPPAGSGKVNTSHGTLPVPVPAVLELARKYRIKLFNGEKYPDGELTTPTGLALMAVLSNSFNSPPFFDIDEIGVGLGNREFNCANFLRIIQLKDSLGVQDNLSKAEIKWQSVLVQEAWIDDATPEDIASLLEYLREAGAIDVICQTVQMKKSRQGTCVKAIVFPENATQVRIAWFLKGTTIGIRERLEGRWVLPRRKGSCLIFDERIGIKQILRPDGRFTIKAEHDDLVRLSKKTGKSLELLRQEVLNSSNEFIPEGDWKC